MSAGTEPATANPARHAVHFAGGEDDLADSVSSYIGAAVHAGKTAIVIATPEHRRAFEARLAGAFDVEAVRVRGRLIALNAAEMMKLVLIGARPDPPSLDLVLGSLIRRALTDSPAVGVYGEMAALLWDAGQVTAAVELEALWSRLGQELGISVLCGYPARLASGPDHAAAVREICQLHTAVTGVQPPA